MSVTMEVSSFDHGDVNEGPVNPGVDSSQRAIESGLLLREAWLGYVQGMRKNRPKSGRLARVTIREGLIGYVESSFLRLTIVEVTDDNAQAIRVARPVPRNIMRQFSEIPKARARFQVYVGNYQ